MITVRILFAIFTAFVLAGCSTVPVEQTKAFRSAVSAIQDAGNLILDEVGAAERKRWLQVNDRSAFTYNPDGTNYYSSITDPTETLQLRAALKVIGDFAELQLVLVEGKNVEAARAQILALASSVAHLANAPGGFTAALNLLSPLIDRLLAAQSAAEARDQIMRASEPLLSLIKSLRAAGPKLFQILAGPLNSRGSGLDRARASEKARLYRTSVANFLVLLDRLEETFTRLQLAYSDSANIVNLANLAQATGALTADVQSIRSTIAALRAL